MPESRRARRPFLTAQWRDLLLLNYEVPESLLLPLIPKGTDLDPWEGKHLVSLVGFRFLDTQVLGFVVPGHRDFEEINLRFYVRRLGPDHQYRRGVVFIRELVPKPMIAWVARTVYGEPYRTAATSHRVDARPGGQVIYQFGSGADRCELSGQLQEVPDVPAGDSIAAFITEHYWGYTRRSADRTDEYRVNHPTWRSTSLVAAGAAGDLSRWYGEEWSSRLAGPPCSAFYAVGSDVSVERGVAL